jgi:hypothetical protein
VIAPRDLSFITHRSMSSLHQASDRYLTAVPEISESGKITRSSHILCTYTPLIPKTVYPIACHPKVFASLCLGTRHSLVVEGVDQMTNTMRNFGYHLVPSLDHDGWLPVPDEPRRRANHTVTSLLNTSWLVHVTQSTKTCQSSVFP